MGMALPLFLLLWAVMMAAMMFPSVAPVAVAWARSIGRQASGWARAWGGARPARGAGPVCVPLEAVSGANRPRGVGGRAAQAC